MSPSVDSAPLEPLLRSTPCSLVSYWPLAALDALDSVAQRRAYPRTAPVVRGCDEVQSTLSLPAFYLFAALRDD